MKGLEEFEIAFQEDIDLNAAVGAIEPMKGQDQLRKASGDQIIVTQKDGLFLKRIRVIDESGGGAGGYLTIEAIERNIYFGKAVGNKVMELNFIGNGGLGLHIPKKTAIDCVGNQSGSGAEQHVVVLSCYSPAIKEIPRIPLSKIKEEFVFGVKSGTIVAQTFGAGTQGILENLEDSEEKFSISPKKHYVLIGIFNSPSGAGYGAVGFRMSDRQVDRVFPAKQVNEQYRYFPVDDENIVPQWGYGFAGDEDPVAMASGVGTTSTELGFHIGRLD